MVGYSPQGCKGSCTRLSEVTYTQWFLSLLYILEYSLFPKMQSLFKSLFSFLATVQSLAVILLLIKSEALRINSWIQMLLEIPRLRFMIFLEHVPAQKIGLARYFSVLKRNISKESDLIKVHSP